jgi:excisionase family DNA binding protein
MFNDEENRINNEWLSLSQVAKVLGVHPGTVRTWADQGHLQVQRTQGGHRRFRRLDVEQWQRLRNGQSVPETSTVFFGILRTTRLQIGEGRLENQAWYRKLDDEARQQYRLSGRNLVQGLAVHLGSTGDGMAAEARSLGYEYASRGQRYGLSCVEAVHAFQFFRTAVMESVLNAYETAGVCSPQVWAEMVGKMISFSDLIMTTLLETYEALQRGTR